MYTPEQVEEEIARLNSTKEVVLARKEETIRYRREKYMRHLQWMERRGAALMDAGITMDNIAEWMAGGGVLSGGEPVDDEE
jgi:hypothetical protein